MAIGPYDDLNMDYKCFLGGQGNLTYIRPYTTVLTVNVKQSQARNTNKI